MRVTFLLLLLIIGAIYASETPSSLKTKDQFKLDYDEQDELDYQPLIPQKDATFNYYGAIPTIQPTPTSQNSLPYIVAYIISGIAGLVLLASLIIGLIAVITTLSRPPSKYNDDIVLDNSENSQTFLDHSVIESNELKINIEKKNE